VIVLYLSACFQNWESPESSVDLENVCGSTKWKGWKLLSCFSFTLALFGNEAFYTVTIHDVVNFTYSYSDDKINCSRAPLHAPPPLWETSFLRTNQFLSFHLSFLTSSRMHSDHVTLQELQWSPREFRLQSCACRCTRCSSVTLLRRPLITFRFAIIYSNHATSYYQERDERSVYRACLLCCRIPCLESAANWLETRAFDRFFKRNLTEEFFFL